MIHFAHFGKQNIFINEQLFLALELFNSILMT